MIEGAYKLYARGLYSFARHLGFDRDTALDCVQDVFCGIIELQKAVHNIKDLKLYLYCALKNRLINLYKSEPYKVMLPTEEGDSERVAAGPDGELPFRLSVTIEDEIIGREEDEELRRRVEAMLNKLPPRQREIIWLRYMQNMEHKQIAEIMNITVAKSHSLLHRAMNNLRKNENGVNLFMLF